MKTNLILCLLGASLTLLLCSCGLTPKPAPETPPKPETGGDPLNITAFSFQHFGSLADDCFLLKLAREENGTHLYAEEQFSGGRIADVMLEEDLLTKLGEVTGMYCVDRWDGFDKHKSNVMDGRGFALELTLADGRTVSARGQNAFPDNFSDVYLEILPLYNDLMERYGQEGVNTP